MYVLDEGLTVTGTLEYIAPEESIYAARFMGDRLYLVTFKRIDPFFVIDLSDPKNPGILGKLKIPGYSDYLHPYDANHIIGVGKETEENQWGGVSTSGLKLALFDVTDVNNPVLAGKVEIGEAGSDSEALRDHKAFLFDRPSGLLVLPVREVLNVERTGTVYKTYAPAVWQGAYVFSVSPDEGFTLKGKVTHGREETPYSYWDSADSVRRSILIGDGLFTISGSEIVVSERGNIGKVIRIIPLPQDSMYPKYPYPVE
ncbi:MAG: Beta propeller domain protein [Methanoregulaceae archaeon PtaB.Bin108]|nr:MAG: Beta propeller domain protein [Methanoregulaceae archaeon PtaB.Bin108]